MSEVEKQRLQVLYEEEKKKYKAKMDKVLTYMVFDSSHRKNLTTYYVHIIAARGSDQKS